MIKINGLKVIGPTEQVIGKVVEPTEGSGEHYKLVEYRINEYNNYVNTELARFSIQVESSKKKNLKEFKKVLGNYVRLSEVFIEESIMNDFLK